MTALDFPNSPTLDQVFEQWRWDGTAWVIAPPAEDGIFDPVDYGADPTGVTDCSAAWSAMWDDIQARRTESGPYWFTQAKVIIPPGAFLFTEPGLFFGGTYPGRTAGIVVEGAGISATKIVFRPDADNEYLVKLDDDLFFFTVRDICFVGDATTNVPNFMHSHSLGGPKDSTFERCKWSGPWQKGIKFTGDNTNGQWAYSKCVWRDTCSFVDGFLWTSDQTYNATTAPDGASTQFKNHWFDTPTVSLAMGKFISVGIGVAPLHIVNGAFLFEGVTTGHPGTFIELRNTSVGHNVGQFSCVNTYFEVSEDGQLIMNCKWNRGHILWENCTYDGQSGTFVDATSISERYDGGNNRFPNIVHRGCGMKGRHEYIYAASSYKNGGYSTYEDCGILGPVSPAAFCLFTPLDLTRLSGQPAVEFVRCRFPELDAVTDQSYNVFDTTPGWNVALAAEPKLHRRNLVSSRGDWMRSVDGPVLRTWKLPLGALLCAVEIRIFTGGNTSTTWSYTLSDATPITIATVAADGVYQLNVPLRQRIEGLNWYCGTDNARTIVLTTTNTLAGVIGEFIIEYVA